MTIDASKILSIYKEKVMEDYFLICRDEDSYADFDTPSNNNQFVQYLLGHAQDPVYRQVLNGTANDSVVLWIFRDFMAGGAMCPESSTFKLSMRFRESIQQGQESGLLSAQTVQLDYSGVTRAMGAQTLQSALQEMPRPTVLPPVEQSSVVPPSTQPSQSAPAWAPRASNGLMAAALPAISDSAAFAATQLGFPTVAPARPDGALPAVSPIPYDVAQVGEGMRHITPIILDTFQKSKNTAELYEVWGYFRTQYLTAMYEIAERLFLTTPQSSGQSFVISSIFSDDSKTREDARNEIAYLAAYAETFAQYILEKANSTFLEKFSVPDRALFMAQLHMIEGIRQKALQLLAGIRAKDKISDTALRRQVQNFLGAWETINSPEHYTNTLLSRMREYITEQKGIWNWLARSTRLWRLKNITISSIGNTSFIDSHRKLQFYRIIDRLIIEASGRSWSSLNVEIGWDGRSRSLTIYSKNNSFENLNGDKSFKEIIEPLGGVLERPAWYAILFVSWRRWRIPFDAPQSSSTPHSIPPFTGSAPPVGMGQGSSSAYGMGYGMGTPSRFGMSHMWSDEPITAADTEEITGYDPDAGITEHIEGTEDVPEENVDGTADAWDAGIGEFFGFTDFSPCEVPVL